MTDSQALIPYEHKSAEAPKKQRKSAVGRKLIRWDPSQDQLVLLHLEYVCLKKGITLPWDEVAAQINDFTTGEGIKQHLAKLRNCRHSAGQPVPPKIGSRGKQTVLKTENNTEKRSQKQSNLLWYPPAKPGKRGIDYKTNILLPNGLNADQGNVGSSPASNLNDAGKQNRKNGLKRLANSSDTSKAVTRGKKRSRVSALEKEVQQLGGDAEYPEKRQVTNKLRARDPVNYAEMELEEEDAGDAKQSVNHSDAQNFENNRSTNSTQPFPTAYDHKTQLSMLGTAVHVNHSDFKNDTMMHRAASSFPPPILRHAEQQPAFRSFSWNGFTTPFPGSLGVSNFYSQTATLHAENERGRSHSLPQLTQSLYTGQPSSGSWKTSYLGGPFRESPTDTSLTYTDRSIGVFNFPNRNLHFANDANDGCVSSAIASNCPNTEGQMQLTQGTRPHHVEDDENSQPSSPYAAHNDLNTSQASVGLAIGHSQSTLVKSQQPGGVSCMPLERAYNSPSAITDIEHAIDITDGNPPVEPGRNYNGEQKASEAKASPAASVTNYAVAGPEHHHPDEENNYDHYTSLMDMQSPLEDSLIDTHEDVTGSVSPSFEHPSGTYFNGLQSPILFPNEFANANEHLSSDPRYIPASPFTTGQDTSAGLDAAFRSIEAGLVQSGDDILAEMSDNDLFPELGADEFANGWFA